MRIAVIAEGCYPYVTGGVSTWCDQLIRGLPDHEFEVVAVTATSRVQPVLALPENVVGVRAVPLWDWTGRTRTARGPVRRAFVEIYRRLLLGLLDLHQPQTAFNAALRDLFEFAQQHDLSSVFASDQVVAELMTAWPRAFPTVPIRVQDAVEATQLIEHMVLPLGAAIPRADVCHPVSNGLPALLALAAKWRHDTPFIMSEHGVYLRERYLAFHTVEYRWPVKTVMLGFMRRICRTAYEQADLIAPVNVFNRRWETRHGAPPDRIRTVYNGVDAEALPEAGQEPERLTVGWVGRVDPLKDVETLVRAMAVVRDQVPEAVLRLFGPTPVGNEAYAQSIKDVIAELDLGDRVTFEGPVRPATTAYHASTVVALSSISEGLPYTVMEAMMCGRATVSTDVGGVAEVTGTAGIVVPPRDPDAFGQALVRVLQDTAARQDMARRARERALEMFQLETMLSTYRRIYQELTGHTAPVAAPPTRALSLPIPVRA